MPPPGGKLKYRVSIVETTLVAGGLGKGTLKSGERISLENIFSSIPEGKDAALVLEIKEYQSQDEEKKVHSHKPEKGVFFSIPVN